jgi:phosphohistidine phosphatase
MRHAKAMKDSADGSDFERDLEERGKKDASEMANAFSKTKIKPQFLIASPAKRTKKTAQIFLKESKLTHIPQELDSHIYLATISDIMHVVHELNDLYQNVVLVGHNPAVTSIIGYLSPTFIEHVPTSGIVVVSFQEKTWKLIQSRSGKIEWTGSPKGHSLV